MRHRLPDRMGQGLAELVGDIPLVRGFYAPKQRVTAPRSVLSWFQSLRKGA